MMKASHTALCAVLLAVATAGCSSVGAGKDGNVATGSIAAEPTAASAVTAAPSLAMFEATELVTGLRCTGSYNPLENNATFRAAVVCSDGRRGTVSGVRPGGLSGTGTLVFADGEEAAVALRRLAQGEAEVTDAPPVAVRQLPAPDPTVYAR